MTNKVSKSHIMSDFFHMKVELIFLHLKVIFSAEPYWC